MSVVAVVDQALVALQDPNEKVSPIRPIRPHSKVLRIDLLHLPQAHNWEKELPMVLIQMKVLNRKAMRLLDDKESRVIEQKEKNDSNRLRLENLLYRKAYLAREIKACKDFIPAEVAAVEAEVGAALIHDSFSADLAARHRGSLAALAGEYQERQRVQELLAKLKEQHVSETGLLDKKMKFLEDLPSRLDAALAGVSQLEGIMPPQEQISSKDSSLQRARRLPGPLYVLYHSLHNVQAVVGDDSQSGGFCLLLSRPVGHSSTYGSKWMYRIDVIETADGATHLELQLRIEVDVPSAETETATLSLRFGMHPDSLTRLVGVSIQSLSFQSKYPFKLEAMLHALYPHDEGESAAAQSSSVKGSAATYYVWAQWLSGLRPVPECPDVAVGNSSGAVLHRVRITVLYEASIVYVSGFYILCVLLKLLLK